MRFLLFILLSPALANAQTNWYLDGTGGSNSNTGTSQGQALKTVAALLAKTIVSGDTINIKRGTSYREQLRLENISGLTVRAYGTGQRPVFDGADTITNFSQSPQYSNIYRTWFTNSFPGIQPHQYSVWENGVRMRRALSKAACDTIDGSYWSPAPTNGGTDSIFINPTGSGDIATNGRLYELSKRSFCVYIGDNSKAYDLHTKRQCHNDGSFKTGVNAYIYNILAEDGVKHNLFLESGTAERCIVWKIDDPVIYGGNTMYVSYSDDASKDTMDVYYKDCVAIGGRTGVEYQSGLIGWYSHVGGIGQYRSVTIDGGLYQNMQVPISSEAPYIVVKNVYANNFRTLYAVSAIDSAYIFNCNMAGSPFQVVNASNAVKKITVEQCKASVNGSFTALKYDNATAATFILKRNTFYTVGQITGTYMGASASTITLDSNILAGTSTVFPTTYVSSTGTFTGRRNFYSSPISHPNSANETNVTNNFNENDFTGTLSTGAWFLPTSNAAFGQAGSTSTFDTTYQFPTVVYSGGVPQGLSTWTAEQEPTPLPPSGDSKIRFRGKIKFRNI